MPHLFLKALTMKCVCPMGGDRTCPDDCLIAKCHNLPVKDRKAQRKVYAEQLYKQKYTMEQIATQLGVAKGTISKDLAGVVSNGNNSERPSKRGRKGEGRPKGKKSKPEHHQQAINLADLGKSTK